MVLPMPVILPVVVEAVVVGVPLPLGVRPAQLVLPLRLEANLKPKFASGRVHRVMPLAIVVASRLKSAPHMMRRKKAAAAAKSVTRAARPGAVVAPFIP
jgi:hypothetical protein